MFDKKNVQFQYKSLGVALLKSLYIKNFAIIEENFTEFGEKLNIITGETGAGKSIILDALNIVLGERASTDLIRNGEEKAIVEANFIVENNEHKAFEILQQNDIDCDSSEIIIRRDINTKGSSRVFINDTPSTVSVLKQIGECLVDLHGQHEHQSLFNELNHLDIFDSITNQKNLKSIYNEKFAILSEFINKNNKLEKELVFLKKEIEYKKYELEEISKIDPKDNEIDEINAKLKLLESSEELYELSHNLTEILKDSEMIQSLKQCAKIVEKLSSLDNSFDEFNKEISTNIISLTEIASFASDYKSNIEFQPVLIEELRNRERALKKLTKKFGSFEEVINIKTTYNQIVSKFDMFSLEIEENKIQIKQLKEECIKLAIELHKSRIDAAKFFEQSIISNLSELGFEFSNFNVDFKFTLLSQNSEYNAKYNSTNYYLAKNGIDQIKFKISTNKGEILKPLHEVASGGEVSRIMLAIKNFISDKDQITTMIFDEIDTGISGRIASKVAKMIKKLAQKKQIICITHLPQIAAAADDAYSVEKYSDNNRTFSKLQKCDQDKILEQIAKLIAGENINQSALDTAAKLIEEVS